MAYFLWNLPIFVAITTRVSLTKIWMTQFDWLTPKPPVRCKNLWPIFIASWVMVNFVWKFPNFCYHGNRGCLTQILLTQLNRQTSKTPYMVQESWWYLLHKLSNGRFLVEICQFCYHGNKVGSNKNLDDSVWLAYSQNPQFGAKIWDVS